MKNSQPQIVPRLHSSILTLIRNRLKTQGGADSPRGGGVDYQTHLQFKSKSKHVRLK